MNKSPNYRCITGARTYPQARQHFLSAVGEAGGGLHSVRHPLPGPGGEPLYLDVASLGDAHATQALLLLSGTHGVEGYCGSMVQSCLLEELARTDLGAGTVVVLVHAVNPHGFAWMRRVTEDGVDLNRNFRDFTKALPATPAFNDALAACLVPARWQGPEKISADLAFAQFQQRHGPLARGIVAGGQHTHPLAPFYGGLAPTWSNHAIRKIVADRFGAVRTAVAIDLHTGLGANGTGQMIAPGHVEEDEARIAARLWGAHYVPPTAQGTVSYALEGGLIDALPQMSPDTFWIRGALEFGTRPAAEVLEAMRYDHWYHAYGHADPAEGMAVGQRMYDAFFDASAAWCHAVVKAGIDASLCALAHFGARAVSAT